MAILRIQVLFHWDSKEARDLAAQLYRTFSARPTGEGPRVPVRYGSRQADDGPPPTIELGAAHEIIVVLADERMARRARQKDREIADRWGRLAEDLLRDHGPGSGSPHRVLPVALDAGALGLSTALDNISFIRLDVRKGAERDRHLNLHIAARALRVLQSLPRAPGQELDALPEIPLRLFISHAKKDLPKDPAAISEGPVKAILAVLAQLPVTGWFDSAEIPPGGRFPEEIESGVLNSSALVAVLTDTWSSREWCRREVLEAKLAARPLIVVDALEARVVRLFPYLGNALTLRWRAAIATTSAFDDKAWDRQRSLWEAEDAALVIEAALMEALRYQHDHLRLLARAGEHEVAMSAPPESLTLAHLPTGTTRVWYPDPPLGREELDRLQLATAQQRIDFTTPLSELALWQRPAGIQTVGVSLSNAPDSDRYGGSPEHLATFADDLVLYLLISGLRVAYGGVLGHDGLQNGTVQGDSINYVERLLAMVRSHSMLLSEVAGKPPIPIENWVAWPIHCRFGDNEIRQYGQEAVLRDLDAPPELNVTPEELDPLENGFFAPDTLARRYAWARSLTFMRESMQKETSARVVMGGKLEHYQGIWPGVLEEGVISVRTRQPLYILGLFGGAGRLLVDALRGFEREELTSAWLARKMPNTIDLLAEYQRRGHPAVQTPEELAAELKRAGAAGLSAALNNGLSEEENSELVVSDDPQRIVTLILTGLSRKLAR
ncbi:TIR domain-containing protein [Mesorhizobium sp. CA7]|uniref:TIR domain-containing protein n=1 Tax=Mesorhizobium sp. CA7 TaxID=588501 RepID=UPI001CC9BA93|nr:TIR domain-containing protein [Mesorhizobium sp. CA7]MBZ9814747.1 TIR domain-containing protein [Mesorhizobium sp. CA7]